MRRAAATLLLLLAVTGCGYSAAETAYLNDMQDRTASIELDDPGATLTEGQAVCAALADTKPGRRGEVRFLLQQPSAYGYGVVHAAMDHLCPELKA